MSMIRLDKYISSAKAASRSEVKSLLKRGAITVNGIPAVSAEIKIDEKSSIVAINGEVIGYSEYHTYMMNKPAGVLSATEDRNADTVLDLLAGLAARYKLSPAGRLDKDAEGLLVLTDDGDLVHRIISPKSKIFKKYYVITEGKLTQKDAQMVEEGIKLTDFTCLPGKLEIIESDEKGSKAYIHICEGKYHQVKRMLASLGKPVVYLCRVSIGGLKLDPKLLPGQYREMSENEIRQIFYE